MTAKRSKGSSGEMTDAGIVELFLRRDEAAIRETERKYARFLFKIAFNILCDAGESEECVSDAYLGAWNSIPPNKPDPLGAYLARITRNAAINRYREKARKKRVPSALTVSIEEPAGPLREADTPDTGLSAKVLAGLINAWLGGLSEKQRYIFIGRYFMGDTLVTIAKELKVSASTVQRESERLKESLKAHLERNDFYV